MSLNNSRQFDLRTHVSSFFGFWGCNLFVIGAGLALFSKKQIDAEGYGDGYGLMFAVGMVLAAIGGLCGFFGSWVFRVVQKEKFPISKSFPCALVLGPLTFAYLMFLFDLINGGSQSDGVQVWLAYVALMGAVGLTCGFTARSRGDGFLVWTLWGLMVAPVVMGECLRRYFVHNLGTTEQSSWGKGLTSPATLIGAGMFIVLHVFSFPLHRNWLFYQGLREGNLSLVKGMRFLGADLFSPVRASGQLPLLEAAASGQEELAAWVLSEMPKSMIEGSMGKRVIFEAIYRGQPQILEVLVKAGASLEPNEERNGPLEKGESPLLLALRFGELEAAEELVKLGLDVRKAQEYTNQRLQGDILTDCSFLYLAARMKAKKLAQSFMDRGIGINDGCGKEKWAPLHHAAWVSDVNSARILLELGADPKIKTTTGLTPRELAHSRGEAKFIEFLDEEGIP